LGCELKKYKCEETDVNNDLELIATIGDAIGFNIFVNEMIRRTFGFEDALRRNHFGMSTNEIEM
jgi:hypothetical protein